MIYVTFYEGRLLFAEHHKCSIDTLPAPSSAPQGTDAPAEAKPEDSREKQLSRSRKPPSDGACKACGQLKPLNRLKLCYRCWVHMEIRDKEKEKGNDWIPTVDPHPSWCECSLPEHPRPGVGN